MKQNLKTILSTVFVVLLVAGLVGVSVHLYQTHKPKPQLTVYQALMQRDEAVRVMNLRDATNSTNQAKLTEQVNDKQNRLTVACAQLKTLTKVVSPACL